MMVRFKYNKPFNNYYMYFYYSYFTNTAGFSDNDEDDGSQSMISTAASSRVSTAKSRASSARLTAPGRWSGAVSSSKQPSSASSKKTNAWASTGDEKQEKVPPLVSSLFAHVPPTVYFFVEGEKGIVKLEELNFNSNIYFDTFIVYNILLIVVPCFFLSVYIRVLALGFGCWIVCALCRGGRQGGLKLPPPIPFTPTYPPPLP